MKNSDLIRSKRHRFDHFSNSDRPVLPRKKHKHVLLNTASVHIKPLGLPLVSTCSNSSSESICLGPYKPYTIGRSRKHCDSVFEDRRVSKKHCQILFDALNRKIRICDSVFWFGSCGGGSTRVRVSVNGVFVNGVRIGRGEVAELGAGDEVSLVCGKDRGCGFGVRIGFVVQRIVFVEEVFDRSLSCLYPRQCGGVTGRVNLLLTQCRQIMHSNDPIWCIQKSNSILARLDGVLAFLMPSKDIECQVGGVPELRGGALAEQPAGEGLRDDRRVEIVNGNKVQVNSITCHRETIVVSEVNPSSESYNGNGNHLQQAEDVEAFIGNGVTNSKPKMSVLDPVVKENTQFHGGSQGENRRASISPPGNRFYLNRLQSIGHDSLGDHAVVSLPELLYPVESLLRIFVATFTVDILWFLSCCEIPVHLPVTIACHNRERCWSSSPDQRTSVPLSDFPNLAVVYPQFPEVVAFGKDRRKSGIACHHPKLLVLQREDSIRVVITSANLGAKQWNSVTNTVWWQDFPRSSRHDNLSLFTQFPDGDINQGSNSDFAAQLAGFMASLLADVPTQAHWILELTKYDFKGAVGHLVASVPGIHSLRAPSILKSMYFLPGNTCASRSEGAKVLGSVETSVVGLSHLFRTSADSNGAQIKKLASFIAKCHENANGMLEILLRRNRNIPADANAVSILVPNPEDFSQGDCLQLGFLPRNVAKWVAPLSDIGLFRFSGCVYPKEVLATALDGSTSKVQMILYVSQGPAFSDMSEIVQSEQVSAICSLVASIQRSSGIWRLQEVLSHYKWPEHLETDFLFCASSIGSVNPQFLAAFSAAAGKTAAQFPESEESDPDWGCWSASQELKNPSIRIIFPTIERVKNASCGILASKYLLCFSQKTWQRLRNIDILRDAIPYPSDRVNHPMHVKVARRCFQSKKDSSSFGWVYSGSHNLSAAAWGRPIYKSIEINAVGAVKSNSVLGSRLHICNYELGIIFIVPPPDSTASSKHKTANLDDIVLPFVVPAPKYKSSDTPATAQAMREALVDRGRQMFMESAAAGEVMDEEVPDDEDDDIVVASDFFTEEKEDEKAYAEKLWSQS
ncbi:uncharacterized protein LOC131335283 isoform X1 [Rhododendron vialii]|uniref:uncharacterized protein LOC131335283 isoform X1 n=2 Tax=Rhododendron vialii TaxID=182163 RepID=UPI00265D7E30|nr:uncharacterized protein LOC131335283 isoform X1 [Rhododendron vialii]